MIECFKIGTGFIYGVIVCFIIGFTIAHNAKDFRHYSCVMYHADLELCEELKPQPSAEKEDKHK